MNARLLDAQIRHQLKVLLGGPDPSGDLGELQPQVPAPVQCLPVLLAVDEELRLPDDPLGSGQPGEEFEQRHNLLHRVGLLGLLPVPEGGVGDDNLLRHGDGYPAVVEGDLGQLAIAVHVPEELGLLHVLQLIAVGVLLQQMGGVGKF